MERAQAVTHHAGFPVARVRHVVSGTEWEQIEKFDADHRYDRAGTVEEHHCQC